MLDVPPGAQAIPQQRWPLALRDPLIANLDRVLALEPLARRAACSPTSSSSRRSPTRREDLNAPINYQAHIDEAKADPKLGGGRKLNHITDWGLFLKATSALIGPGEPIRLHMPDPGARSRGRLAVVIGRECRSATLEKRAISSPATRSDWT